MIDVNEVDPRSLEQSLYKTLHEMTTARRKHRDADRTFKRLKVYKDALFKKLCKEVEAKTTAEKEREATLSPSWKINLDGLCAAEEAADDLKLELDNLRDTWETYRSILSSRNAERHSLT